MTEHAHDRAKVEQWLNKALPSPIGDPMQYSEQLNAQIEDLEMRLRKLKHERTNYNLAYDEPKLDTTVHIRVLASNGQTYNYLAIKPPNRSWYCTGLTGRHSWVELIRQLERVGVIHSIVSMFEADYLFDNRD